MTATNRIDYEEAKRWYDSNRLDLLEEHTRFIERELYSLQRQLYDLMQRLQDLESQNVPQLSAGEIQFGLASDE